jgi:histidinol-phosphate aminotransferase
LSDQRGTRGPRPLPNLSAIEVYKPGRPIEEVRRELGLTRVVKLASNENPLGPSPKALAATRRELAECHRYPDGSASDLRTALSESWGLPGSRFIFGNGSNEVLILAAQAFCGPGDEVAYSARSFAVYRIATLLARAKPREAASLDFRHDLEALAHWARRARLLFLCNPNNPTGSWHGPKAIEALLKKVPRRCLVVLDEAYAEYAGDGMAKARAWLSRFPNLLICRTFSKAYGLAGWRVGYGVASEAVVQALEKARQPFNVNRLALAAALAALGDGAFLRRSLATNRRGLSVLQSFFRKRGIWHLPSKANFVFFREPQDGPSSGQTWFRHLLGRGVIVRPIEPGYLRVTVGTPAENRLFMKVMEEGLKTG